MFKLNLWLALIAIAAISISRKVRLSGKYERSDKKVREISDWNSLDRGIDPTVKDEE